jgi:hypothetical protein
MHYLDNDTRCQLMRERRHALADEMRRARGPMPLRRNGRLWSIRLATILARAQPIPRGEGRHAPALDLLTPE